MLSRYRLMLLSEIKLKCDVVEFLILVLSLDIDIAYTPKYQNVLF